VPEEKYHGVPRSKIHWSPIINYEKCVICGTCVDYCKLGVFEFEEKEEKKRPLVKNPNNYVVFCTGCEEQCAVGAIKFPCKKGTREPIKN
jgi:NAD-dependent dihydropyrimidine dehydrogenase PreA subunit